LHSCGRVRSSGGQHRAVLRQRQQSLGGRSAANGLLQPNQHGDRRDGKAVLGRGGRRPGRVLEPAANVGIYVTPQGCEGQGCMNPALRHVLVFLGLAVLLWLTPEVVFFVRADWHTRRSMWQAWLIRRRWTRLSRMQGLAVMDPTP